MGGALRAAGWTDGKSNGKRYLEAPGRVGRVGSKASVLHAHEEAESISESNKTTDPVRPCDPDFPVNIGAAGPAPDASPGGEPADPDTAPDAPGGEPRGRIAFRLHDGEPHAPGCTLPATHRGPCWLLEPPPEPLTDDEYAALERLPRVPAIVNGDTPAVRRWNALRSAHGLAPVSLGAQLGDREALDASAFFDRLAETARRAGAGLPGAVA